MDIMALCSHKESPKEGAIGQLMHGLGRRNVAVPGFTLTFLPANILPN
jgi:hypothetical protein